MNLVKIEKKDTTTYKKADGTSEEHTIDNTYYINTDLITTIMPYYNGAVVSIGTEKILFEYDDEIKTLDDVKSKLGL